jgi:catechol 2,3-dioxygenase-like lactoylglutathione lyase family enzyme
MPLSNYHLNASIAVSDIPKAVAFYEGKLGLQALEYGPSAHIPDGSRIYGSGGGPALMVYQSVTAGNSPATLATWYVDDIDAMVDELSAADVEFARYDDFEHDAKGITARAGGRAHRLVPGPRRQHLRHRSRLVTTRPIADRGGRWQTSRPVGS